MNADDQQFDAAVDAALERYRGALEKLAAGVTPRATDIGPACQMIRDQFDTLRARCARLEGAINEIDVALCVPAAEYVPAIRDVFAIIDQVKT